MNLQKSLQKEDAILYFKTGTPVPKKGQPNLTLIPNRHPKKVSERQDSIPVPQEQRARLNGKRKRIQGRRETIKIKKCYVLTIS
jgi:hypothetical protein